jgi:hypothetical protein
MIELGALLLFGVAIVAVVIAFATILKLAFWAILLPFRLLFWLLGAVLMLPVLLFKGIVGGLSMVLAVPLGLVGVILAGIGLAFALVLPALPVILMVVAIYYLLRPSPAPLVRS